MREVVSGKHLRERQSDNPESLFRAALAVLAIEQKPDPTGEPDPNQGEVCPELYPGSGAGFGGLVLPNQSQ
jgi:hypothetical protein